MKLNQTISGMGIFTLITICELFSYSIKYIEYTSAMDKLIKKYQNKEADMQQINRLNETGNILRWPTPLDLLVLSYFDYKRNQEGNEK